MSATEDLLQLDRPLSWQDVRDVPYLSTRRPSIVEGENGYRYVDCTNRKYRKPPIQFSISVLRIDGNTAQTTCRPGSIFEGVVRIKLATPLAAEQLKLVFKAAESVYGTSRKRGQRLFAIKTVLWGAVTGSNNSMQWPIMETGEHQFPFMCEIPQVNYPPTFRHHLASCEFELLACLDRPGIRPFQTIPYALRYEPFVFSPIIPAPYKETIELNQANKVLVTLPNGCYFNLLDADTDILKIQVSSAVQAISQIEASLKREVIVRHGSYSQRDTMVMSHVEQSRFGVVKNEDGSCTYYIRLPVPSEVSKNNNSSILRNFSVLGMTPSLCFSKYIKMDYKLYVTAKVKYGLISTRKQLCSIPIHFGTTSYGQTLSENLLSYRDRQVTMDTSLRTKPRFIKPGIVQEQLPAYDEDLSPPEYLNCVA
ncbi:hypothetical protein EDC94DRAFT_695904 [Helicostylum pulchrum]|uniref:Arrestin-like N-terminal domain-containing protein n=1 Tax=Helicostylum pulchrum TaxID=562976 RepID=A0ABP9XNW6_9FUNG|nr:hypothetical protein EDC94DRAFT_695904 [Helicostylum pulchrum]